VKREYRKGREGEMLAYYCYVPSKYELYNAEMRQRRIEA